MAKSIVSLNYILRPAPGEKGILLVEKNCWERGPGVAETNPPPVVSGKIFSYNGLRTRKYVAARLSLRQHR
jgi:hypothetical protein